VLFALTAREATWGGPVWWPVAVGAAMCAPLVFAAGVAAVTLRGALDRD
jgi:hypothetical protein